MAPAESDRNRCDGAPSAAGVRKLRHRRPVLQAGSQQGPAGRTGDIPYRVDEQQRPRLCSAQANGCAHEHIHRLAECHAPHRRLVAGKHKAGLVGLRPSCTSFPQAHARVQGARGHSCGIGSHAAHQVCVSTRCPDVRRPGVTRSLSPQATVPAAACEQAD